MDRNPAIEPVFARKGGQTGVLMCLYYMCIFFMGNTTLHLPSKTAQNVTLMSISILKKTLTVMVLAAALSACCKNDIDFVESPADLVSTLVGTEST